MQSPIFIFSLPRSGSTLLQRVLMTNKKICSVAEPWLLLPQLYVLKKEGTLSEYSSLTGYVGTRDFISNLPNKEDDYLDSLRDFMTDLYRKQCKNDEQYFLDKTPRYYLIINEIAQLFPEAKFIFLFRNPIHIYASIINTWGNNRFNKLFKNYNDLSQGFNLLTEGYLNFKNRSVSINYESFINNPEEELKKLSMYLDIDLNKKDAEHFSNQKTKGLLGDPTGNKLYSNISNEGLTKWKNTFNSFLRKKFAIQILNKISDDLLAEQGYSKSKIKQELNDLNNAKNYLIIQDLFDYSMSCFVRKTNFNLIKSKEFSWVRKRFLS